MFSMAFMIWILREWRKDGQETVMINILKSIRDAEQELRKELESLRMREVGVYNTERTKRRRKAGEGESVADKPSNVSSMSIPFITSTTCATGANEASIRGTQAAPRNRVAYIPPKCSSTLSSLW